MKVGHIMLSVTGHMTHYTGNFKVGFKYLYFRERDHWGDPDINGRIVLRWIFGKWEGVGTGWSWLRIGTDGEHL